MWIAPSINLPAIVQKADKNNYPQLHPFCTVIFLLGTSPKRNTTIKLWKPPASSGNHSTLGGEPSDFDMGSWLTQRGANMCQYRGHSSAVAKRQTIRKYNILLSHVGLLHSRRKIASLFNIWTSLCSRNMWEFPRGSWTELNRPLYWYPVKVNKQSVHHQNLRMMDENT